MEIHNSDPHSEILPIISKCKGRFQNHEDAAQSLLSFSKENENEYSTEHDSLSDLPNMERSHRSSLDFILNSSNDSNDTCEKRIGEQSGSRSQDSLQKAEIQANAKGSLNYQNSDTKKTPFPHDFTSIRRPSPQYMYSGPVVMNAQQYNHHLISHLQNTQYSSLQPNNGNHPQSLIGNPMSRSFPHYMHPNLLMQERNQSYNSTSRNLVPRHSLQQYRYVPTLPTRPITPITMNMANSVQQRNSSAVFQKLHSNNSSSISPSNINIKEDNDNSDDSQKRRRLDPSQLRVLEGVFEYTYFPSTELRRRLAQQLGLTPRTIQIWFQNKRQNWRNRARQEEQTCTSIINQQRLQIPESSGPYPSLSSPAMESLSNQQLVFSNIAPRDIELQRLRRESDVYILSKPEIIGALSKFHSNVTGSFVEQTLPLRKGY